LSFAQFERELIGERVQDKIAASKRKGLWVGSPVPLGYSLAAELLDQFPVQSIVFATNLLRNRWTRGSSPRMTHLGIKATGIRANRSRSTAA
jgi:DNA invertase Pin-like site-specific DNA recombinase